MPNLSFNSETDLKNYLKEYAPYSAIDRGIDFLAACTIGECSKSGGQILTEMSHESESFQVKLDLRSGRKIIAGCNCCSEAEMEEQWCPHAIASIWHSWKTDLLAPQGGFGEPESAIRINQKTSEEIADLLKQAAKHEYEKRVSDYYPEVKIELIFDADRLGVKVFFDDQPQTYQGFEKSKSARELDNVLIQVLEDEGAVDEEECCWYINSSHSIGIVFGLLEEYKQVIRRGEKKKVTFMKELLNACITTEWHDASAELVMYWVLPNGKKIAKDTDLIGTGPFWTAIGNDVYKLSPTAAQIASIFPFSSTITLSRKNSAPILEVLQDGIIPSSMLDVINPKEQPESEVKDPLPVLQIERADEDSDTWSAVKISLKADLQFDYPEPPANKNVVYLPNREKEQSYIDEMAALGFKFLTNKQRYFIYSDDALDLIKKGEGSFSEGWEINGLKNIQQETKFSALKLNVNINSAEESYGKKAATGGIDWFDCNITLTQNNANIPISLIFKNASVENDRWLKLDNGAWAEIPGGGLTTLKSTLGMINSNFRHSNSINAKLNTAQAISLNRFNGQANFAIHADKKLADLTEKMQTFTSIQTINQSPLFEGKLRSYQKEGLSWLNFLNEFGLDGILADEMGLGKTVQTLALLQYLKNLKDGPRKINKPTLIVCPTSVTTNWLYEARRFTPNLKAIMLHGPKRKDLFQQVPESDIVITSYALLRSDRQELERQEFSYIILDEAQNIKNPLTATAKAAKALRASRRLALTGTPTENRPLELWSIFDYLMPGYLGTYDFFRNNIEKPILNNQTGIPAIRMLNNKTKPFILRRLKSDVEKQLPPKIESNMHVAMTDSQKQLYAQILEEVRPKVLEAIEQKGVRGASISILAALLRLRQVCNHPNSIDGLKDLPGYDSGKFELLKELLEESFESGRKILLFSQFREMLAIIRRWLEEKSINYLYLDGATKNRQQLVDQFNQDEKVKLFLISLKAGGTGLNLTAADTVVIYDPWWNPAVENQAIDRAHRIGQTKHVNVYRLITEDSIEQKIMDLKARKSSIIDALINENGLSSINLTKDELDSLFSPLT